MSTRDSVRTVIFDWLKKKDGVQSSFQDEIYLQELNAQADDLVNRLRPYLKPTELQEKDNHV